MRDSLTCLMQSVAIGVEAFESGRAFFAGRDPERPACLIVDLRMPGQSGLEVQECLAAEDEPIPVIFVSGHGDIPTAVRAMKSGAVEFLTKPFSEEVLLRCVRRALRKDQLRRREQRENADLRARLEQLTAREVQVLDLVVQGASNKAVARELGISPKTVELHRANVMRKMRAGSLADLVQMYVRLDPDWAAGAAGAGAAARPGAER